MKININERIERMKKHVIVIGLLSFLAIALTHAVNPERAPTAALLCLPCFTLMFGWTLGLMDARRNAKD